MVIRDLTGSGKTLAYSIPIVEYLRENKMFESNMTNAIILTPTRELALQVTETLEKLKHSSDEYRVFSIFGGVSFEKQQEKLATVPNIVVATTGRLMDHLKKKNLKNFQRMKHVVIDEADKMLEMGFKEDVDCILNCVKKTTKKRP